MERITTGKTKVFNECVEKHSRQILVKVASAMTMKKFTITEISEWELDSRTEQGYYGHVSCGDIMRQKLDEYEQKVERGEWPGLPFACMAYSKEEAIGKYNDTHCNGDYYKAVDAEFEE